jgi:hypothetical protein
MTSDMSDVNSLPETLDGANVQLTARTRQDNWPSFGAAAGVLVQPACLVYEFVRPVSTYVSSDVRPASTDVGIRCFSGGALVASRSSSVYSARVIEPEP